MQCHYKYCLSDTFARSQSTSSYARTFRKSYEIGTGMLIIYSIAAIIRMGNWAQNDTYRSAGDAAFGSIMEITFMYLMVLPFVYLLILFSCTISSRVCVLLY